MTIPKKVNIVEVGPRDGLQNEAVTVPLEIKLGFIKRLRASGLSVIEAGSFVSPAWVPQMADTTQVLEALRGEDKDGRVSYPVLVPNLKGLKRAIKAGAREIAIFTAASESFSLKNNNQTISEVISGYQELTNLALGHGIRIRGYISCALGCPYEGKVALSLVTDLAETLMGMGCYQIALADTVGCATPLQVQKMLRAVLARVPVGCLAVHFHDTYGQALANIYAALQEGIEVVDSAVAGLGGCPFAKVAGANVASEDLLYMLAGLGIETGIDLKLLVKAGDYITEFLKKTTGSKLALAMADVTC